VAVLAAGYNFHDFKSGGLYQKQVVATLTSRTISGFIEDRPKARRLAVAGPTRCILTSSHESDKQHAFRMFPNV
jgi:hypothetical protein